MLIWLMEGGKADKENKSPNFTRLHHLVDGGGQAEAGTCTSTDHQAHLAKHWLVPDIFDIVLNV